MENSETFLPPGLDDEAQEEPLSPQIKAFERLVKRAATDAEKVRLLETARTLKISDDDAVWVIFVALQYHLALYEQMPERITQAQQELFDQQQAQLDRQFDAARKKQKDSMQQIVAQAQKAFLDDAHKSVNLAVEAAVKKHVKGAQKYGARIAWGVLAGWLAGFGAAFALMYL